MEKICQRSGTGNGSVETERRLVTTADGSKTIYHAALDEHYHSINGALQESRHVFLESGLKHFVAVSGQKNISVLEIGFGTGLNFLLSASYCNSNRLSLQYQGIEPYPLPQPVIAMTGYQEYIGFPIWNPFISLYEQALEKEIPLSSFIRLQITSKPFQQFETGSRFNIIYFDAFASGSQPEMWTAETIDRAVHLLDPGGIFVTYAANANLKRNLLASGCRLEKLPGAAGKREMLRATIPVA